LDICPGAPEFLVTPLVKTETTDLTFSTNRGGVYCMREPTQRTTTVDLNE